MHLSITFALATCRFCWAFRRCTLLPWIRLTHTIVNHAPQNDDDSEQGVAAKPRTTAVSGAPITVRGDGAAGGNSSTAVVVVPGVQTRRTVVVVPRGTRLQPVAYFPALRRA